MIRKRHVTLVQLNVKAFLALRAVINEGTVTAAAERLHRTQPAVSRLVAQLESDVGFALFRREGRRLLPTADGLTFYRESERALAALAEIESTARDIAKGRGTPLRIIAQSHLVHGLLHVVLGQFCAEHPAFRFKLEIRQDEHISHWIANRLFDVGFTPQRADHPQIANEFLMCAPLVVMLPAQHRLAKAAAVRAAEVAGDPVVVVRPGAPLRERLDAFFAREGVAPLIRGETTFRGLRSAARQPGPRNHDRRSLHRPSVPRRSERRDPAARAARRNGISRLAARGAR